MTNILPNLPDVNQPLLFEMMRSFTTLARTLNLSHAVTELNSTRQTVRRHISQLEVLRGKPLFYVSDRRYELTDEGHAALPEAEALLTRSRAWSRGEMGSYGALQYLQTGRGDWVFYQQQQAMGSIWKDESVLLRETYRAWMMASGEIENQNLAHVRAHLLVFRHAENGWICVEFGERSAYVKWFGHDYARSSVGRPIARLPAGEELGQMLDQSFVDIETAQTARLDHVYTRMPLPHGEKQVTMVYQRLMMAGFFPDGSPAVITLVEPTSNVNIVGLDAEMRKSITDIMPSDFDPKDAFFEQVAKRGPTKYSSL
ncbi:MAG: LysR family transcriptional regulator [Tateyamaria sp.]|uniref:helix-turn-helix domain-containing protein n=1 Tax=Tateyamaria sp. TaxID=1929288 RepID=UPI00329F8EA9